MLLPKTLIDLAAEASARLRRERQLAPSYVESLAHLASVHVRERYLQKRPTVLQRPPVFLAPLRLATLPADGQILR